MGVNVWKAHLCDSRLILYPLELSTGNVSSSIWPNANIVLEEEGIAYEENYCLRNEVLIIITRDGYASSGFIVYNWVTQEVALQVMYRMWRSVHVHD